VHGNAELAAAKLLVPDWDLYKVEEEFDEFRRWSLAKGARSANWPASRQTWCKRGREYEARHEGEPKSGLEAAMRGAADWLDEEWDNETKH
jgi:hypothetical protein